MSDEDFEDESPAPQGPSEFAQMLDASFKQSQRRLSVGDKIRGEILVIGKEDVFVSTGTMNDGIVPRKDLLDEQGNVPHQVGDVLDLYVTQVRGNEIHLSPKKTAKNLADDLEDAHDMMLPVEGRVVELVKGGFLVQLQGSKLAFCPVSQMDIKRIETPEEYVGKRFEFRIHQMTEGGRNIVVSRRKLLEEEREASAGSFLQERRTGDIVPGRVSRLEKFGAFIELAPGIDGLAHISELAWSRVGDPSEVVSVGQEVMAKVLKIESDESGRVRIGLSLKQAQGEPWDRVPEQVRVGAVVPGKVTKCMKFGAFVELAPGLEGLIPLSEMSYVKRVVRSDELVKEGESVLVKVISIDAEARRIGLSLKDAGEDPWALAGQKFPVGKIISGRIERREPYGLFVKLEEGVVGLLPKSRAADHPEFPFEKLRVGDTATVQVAELRLDERRISLDVPKDPGSDDWKGFVAPQTGGGGFATLGDKLKAVALVPARATKAEKKTK
jgi:small subunit ribosomal protein S1